MNEFSLRTMEELEKAVVLTRRAMVLDSAELRSGCLPEYLWATMPIILDCLNELIAKRQVEARSPSPPPEPTQPSSDKTFTWEDVRKKFGPPPADSFTENPDEERF